MNDVVKEQVFKICKFVTSLDQETVFVNQVIDGLGEEEHKGNAPAAKNARATFQFNCSSHCVQELNQHRNCMQSRMKDKAFSWMRSNDGKLPPFKDILDCAQRKLPVNDTNKTTILHYVDEMMPRMSGISRFFSPKLRYYDTISNVKADPTSCYPDIAPDTEAMGLLMMENAKSKWPKLCELEKTVLNKGNKRIQVLPSRKASHEGKESSIFFCVEDHKDLAAKYTEPSVGQKIYGGWSGDGVKRYVLFRKTIVKSRGTEYGKKWEADALEMLRKEYKITEASHELQRKKDGRNKNNNESNAVEEIKELFDRDAITGEEIEELVEV